MKATIHQLITGSAPLTALIPTERWYTAGSVVDVPIKPFAILRWITPVAGAAKQTYAHQLRVEVYDNRGSYQEIGRILGGPHRSGGVFPLLAGISDLVGPDGRVTMADYLGESGDDVNVDYKANMRYSSWQIIGRTTS